MSYANGYGGKLADPQFRRERAAKASAAANSIERYVRAIVTRAPELTEDQIVTLRALLPATERDA